MAGEPLVYDLTPMTRKADEGRRFVISGFDIKKRTMLIGGLALVPGLVMTGILFKWLQMWSLLSIPLFLALAFWLFEWRSSQGMKLRNWRALLDKRQASNGQFYICGHPVDVMYSDITFVRTATVPVERKVTISDDPFEFEEAS